MQLAADPQGEFEVPLPPERASIVREQVQATLYLPWLYSTAYGRCKPRWAGYGYTYHGSTKHGPTHYASTYYGRCKPCWAGWTTVSSARSRPT